MIRTVLARLGLRSLPLAALCLALTWAAAAPAAPHEHPEKGPHGGPLLELGDEEYHVELLIDEKTDLVTAHVLDATGKKPVSIDAKDVAINLKHDKRSEQFKLAAAPDKGDKEGASSRFRLKSHELVEDLHDDKVDARLAVKIKGKSYNAKVALKHDHDHDHKR